MADKIGTPGSKVKRAAAGTAGRKVAGAALPARPRKAGAAKPAAPRPPRIPYSKAEIEEFFRRLAVQRPEPKGELEHSNPFTLLVAVVLSAQATDAGVNKATRALFARADNAAAMAGLGVAAIEAHIRTIGLFRTKARNVAALAQALVERHGGAVPRDRESLEALPGVGRKTASVVLNSAFGEEVLAVDTHILRLGNRLRMAPGKTPEAVEAGFLRIIPAPYRRHAHHWLILHGRYVCKARTPDCEACVVADLCKAAEKRSDVPYPLTELAEGAGSPRVLAQARAAPSPPENRSRPRAP
ncbi:endonuclease III [Aurantimonas sp. Leaf443]|uniref:endonuclease III n=1 Tax=Aurantimonas sp. Leaf443 TaxID=1736378 RepID=UPI0006F790DC|nr:endonuclease III [Aurantimonas sp. Leaf443]KQT83108.1 endonuclease III [Aurantimonas sp. Leaf443]